MIWAVQPAELLMLLLEVHILVLHLNLPHNGLFSGLRSGRDSPPLSSKAPDFFTITGLKHRHIHKSHIHSDNVLPHPDHIRRHTNALRLMSF